MTFTAFLSLFCVHYACSKCKAIKVQNQRQKGYLNSSLREAVMRYISLHQVVSGTTLSKNRIAVSVHVPKVTPHVAIVFDCHSSERIRRYMAAYSGVGYHTSERSTVY